MGSFFSAPKEAPRCRYSSSKRCVGERRSGGPFWEVLCITYTYANSRCSLEICQKGIAKRVDNLCVTLLDKDNGTNVVVDAEVVVTAVQSSSSSRAYNSSSKYNSRMSVRNCNLAPHKGVLENWSQSFNSVEAIRYFTPTRDGMFSLTTPINANDVNGSTGTITHHFATKDSDDAGFCVEVKFKMEASKGLRVHVDGPKLRPNICFTDHVEIEVFQGNGGGGAGAGAGPGPVILTSLPPPQPQDANENARTVVRGHENGYLHCDSSQKSSINQHGGDTPNPNYTNLQHSHPQTQDGRDASSLAALGKQGFELIEQLYKTRLHKPYHEYYGGNIPLYSGATTWNSNASTSVVCYGGVEIMHRG